MPLAIRVKKLESDIGLNRRNQYFMLVGPEIKNDMFHAVAYAEEFGGTGENVEIEGWQEVVNFTKRDDVKMNVYSFFPLEELGEAVNKPSTFHFIDFDEPTENDLETLE